ncbi:uncharacterized protein LOC141776410 isoform X2 [Sebastes fasciatus]|uniref:uncharacterized protein LOC141776410 isoform X2 n=1 Tax=Sebastes fasciatus TaxID=394691 RepID=UPI003D9DFFBC
MSPAAALHQQLASIMEVLANTAVAEICELVDEGYSLLQLEISRSRKENDVLRRKLRLTELRNARTSAVRAAAATARAAASGTASIATASGTASIATASGPATTATATASGTATTATASGTAPPQLPAHHLGNGSRRSRTPTGEAARSRASNQETLRCGDPDASSDSGHDGTQPAAGESTKLTTAVIKVEDDEESWSQSEQDKDFCCVVDGQTTETEAPPPLTKQEVPDEGGGSSLLWVSGEVSSTSVSVQETLNTSQRSDTSSYDCLMYEPQLQHGSLDTQNPLSEDPGCSYMLSTGASVLAASDSGSSSFPFTIGEASLSTPEHQQPAGLHSNQQRAPLPADEPQLPARKGMTARLHAFVRRDRWRPQDGVGREDSGERTFVCNCCGKTLACLKNLKTHMRVHTGEKPFVCVLCGKRFSDSSNLKRHQSVHTGEKRYGCVHCGKRFAQSGSLKVHMTVHTDCKQFRCSYCGKTFISGSHLRRHVTMHGGE